MAWVPRAKECNIPKNWVIFFIYKKVDDLNSEGFRSNLDAILISMIQANLL